MSIQQAEMAFESAYLRITGVAPFPWQRSLHDDWYSTGKVPACCAIPTGLGKTSVIAKELADCRSASPGGLMGLRPQ